MGLLIVRGKVGLRKRSKHERAKFDLLSPPLVLEQAKVVFIPKTVAEEDTLT